MTRRKRSDTVFEYCRRGVITIRLKKALYYALIAVITLALFAFGALEAIELKAQDRLYKDLGMADPNIFVFGIDEETLIEFGPFQFWPRQRMADAISILNSIPDEKPAVIAVDILYSGLSGDTESDAALVKAAAEGGNTIFGAMASYSWDGSVKTYERPFDALERVSSHGAMNTVVDIDGFVRRAEIYLDIDGNAEPSLAASIYEMYMGGSADIPENGGEPLYLTLTGGVGDYYGAEGLGTSFADIFDEDFDPSFYAGAVILIGPYASGLMDSYFTAADPRKQMHGIEIHANILQMLLDENYKIYLPVWMNFLVLCVTMTVLILIFARLDIRIAFAALILFAASYIFMNKWLFGAGYITTLVYPLLAAAALFIFTVVYNYITERIEKQKIKAMFRKYVDPKLVDELISSDISESGIGRKKHFAVMFVDIRGFTPMSEQLKDEPETVVAILNDYLEFTASCVFDNGGSVDKFIGDATMALFNGFTPLEDYVFKAVKTAYDIANGAEALNARILEKYGKNIGFGVGVHCGYAVVGNIGPNFRKDYTAIGDTVNTAARLESNAKASQVLISKDVYEMLEGRITADSIGELTMKGKGSLEVFSLTGIVPDISRISEHAGEIHLGV